MRSWTMIAIAACNLLVMGCADKQDTAQAPTAKRKGEHAGRYVPPNTTLLVALPGVRDDLTSEGRSRISSVEIYGDQGGSPAQLELTTIRGAGPGSGSYYRYDVSLSFEPTVDFAPPPLQTIAYSYDSGLAPGVVHTLGFRGVHTVRNVTVGSTDTYVGISGQFESHGGVPPDGQIPPTESTSTSSDGDGSAVAGYIGWGLAGIGAIIGVILVVMMVQTGMQPGRGEA